jgi:hypothetical protein
MHPLRSLGLLLIVSCAPAGVVLNAESGDVDGDGYVAADKGGADCDDDDADVHPGAEDEPYDGIDADCDDASDFDADGDGHDSDAYGGDDCNDADASVHAGATDAAYDGVDSDCLGDSDFDADGDGHDAPSFGGDDCNDADATIYPGAEETWYDGVDDNCDGLGDDDADGDGFDAESQGGEDCNDADPDAFPGAYDLPNDGVDQDCDGADRELDGAVVAFGEQVDYDLLVSLEGLGGLDVAFLMDTTCSMGTALSGLSFTDVAAGLTGVVDDLRLGYATFDDYAYGSYGTAGTDKPFILRRQVTSDLAAVQAELDDSVLHSGGDGPEGSMEALYQALTGAGYDQDCDGSYDTSSDVFPLMASATDPFSGLGGESWDGSVAGGGARGGLGFRGGTTPVILYITDNYMRDPDAGYGTPGGCPLDAGAADVIDAAADLGAFLVGISTGSGYGAAQMAALATSTGSLVDSNGDGVADDPAVYTTSGSAITDAAIEALLDVAAVISPQGVYAECSLAVKSDPYAMVTGIDPASYTDVDVELVSDLAFTVTLEGTTVSSVALTVEIELVLQCDGFDADTTRIIVEIPPG